MISTLIRYSFSHAKPLPSAKLYVERFAGLQGTLKDQLKKINQLQNQTKLASQAQVKTLTDKIKELFSNLSGSAFEPKALQKQREELIEHRKLLQELIQNSNLKWQQPREEIKKIRKEMADEFLSNFVKLEENLLKNCSCQTSPELAEGLNLIHRLLVTTITKHGVKFYEPKLGDAYDPELYDTADEGGKGKIIKQVVSRGWRIEEKIIKKPIVRLE